ncbi:MAG: nucleotidyltransferase family protein [Clostridia bacterium]|nr:nucleotidyltransferase family protein [Clostridia bacterium]
MNNIADIMLGAIRAQVCGCEYEINKNISDEEIKALYVLSKHQDMAHIVAAELARQGLLKNDEVGAKFKKQQMLAVLRYERINYELSEICRVLEEAEIDHIPLKGSVIREYYLEPWMRTSADIDMLVHIEDFDRARDVIAEKLGYTTDNEKHEHDISMFAPSGVHLELHFATVEEYCAVNAKEVLADIWKHAYVKEGCAHRFVLGDDLFYFYHVAHMAKHYEYGGVGVRFYLDMWLLNRIDHDREKREAMLLRGGLLTFERVSAELCRIWFEGGAHNERTLRMARHVLQNGIYGTKENNLVWNQISEGGKTKRALNMIFLPYENMVIRYPSLKKHKVLFPFYQVRRWCSIVIHGRTKKSMDKLKENSDVTRSQRDDVESMLKDLELIK